MTGLAALEVDGLSRSFGATRALDGVTLAVRAGEVHALLGQNGCGKSTLIKCLTGVYQPDAGEARVFGTELEFPVTDAAALGIAVIHQDIGLVDTMTVLENIGVTSGYGRSPLGWISLRSERRIARSLMDELGIDLDLDLMVADLSPAERALLAVVRAFRVLKTATSGDRKHLFILDEPTAPLSQTEARIVLGLMRRIADLGNGVMFVSHRLAEVMDVCDRLTVMRAGQIVMTTDAAATSRADIVAAMLGRRMDEYFPRPPTLDADAGEPPLLAVRGLQGEHLEGLDLDVRGGEIIGVTGLVGMGQEELPRILAGDRPCVSGEVRLDGEPAHLRTPADAIAAKVVLVPGNRLRDGCWPEGSASENITVPILDRFVRATGIDRGREREWSAERMTALGTVPAIPTLPMTSFSGGNQQKIVFAKWLQCEPRLLLLDEPTQGVDPAAAKDLLTRVTDAAVGGAAALVVSGDYEMLAEICHRVVILNHGRVVDELSGDDLTEAAILHACESTPAPVA